MGNTISATPSTANNLSTASHQAANTTSSGNILKRRLKGNMVWTVFGRISGLGISLVLNIVLARVMQPDEFGMWGLVYSVSMVGMTFGNFSLNTLMTKYVAELLPYDCDSELQSLVLRICRISRVTALVAGLASAAVIKFAFSSSIVGNSNLCALLTGVVTFLCVVCSVRAGYFNGIHRSFVTSVLVPITSGLVVGPIMLLLVLSHAAYSASSVTIFHILAYWMLSLIALYIACEVCFHFVKPTTSLRPDDALPLPAENQRSVLAIVTSAIPFVTAQVLFQLQLQIDLWIGTFFVSSRDLGELTAAKRIASLIDLPVAIGNLALGSTIAEFYSQRRLSDLQALSRRSSTLLCCLLLFPCICTFFAGNRIMEFIFGAAYQSAGMTLFLLMLSRFAYVVGGPCEIIMTLTGGGRSPLTAYVTGTIAILVAAPLLALSHGIEGLAVASGFGIALSVAILCYSIHRRDGIVVYASVLHPEYGLRWWLRSILR
jgi:O-antigen/teichoic acid export membrane protein